MLKFCGIYDKIFLYGYYYSFIFGDRRLLFGSVGKEFILMPQIPQISGPLTGGKTLTSGNSGSNVPQGTEPFSVNGVNPVQRPSSVTQKGGAGGAENTNLSGTPASSLGVPAAKDPSMAVETLHDVFSGDLLENAKLNGYTELVGELDDLTKAIYINPDKLMNEILTQEKDNTVFSGNKLFDILRSVSAQSGEDTKELVANLLKSLNYLMSRNDIIRAVKSNVKFLADYFGKGTTLSKNLNQLFEKWDTGNPAENFDTLKNETAALMKTIEGSLQNDARTEVLVPLVTHNLSRYNTNEYMMKEAFSQLMSQIPSSAMRDELSKAFTEFASKLITDARNSTAQSEGSAPAAGADVSAEKAAILVYLSKLAGSLEEGGSAAQNVQGNETAFFNVNARDASEAANADNTAAAVNPSDNALDGMLLSITDKNGNVIGRWQPAAVDENGNVLNLGQLAKALGDKGAGEPQRFVALDENGKISEGPKLIAVNEKGEPVSGRQIAAALEDRGALSGLRFAAVDENGNIMGEQRLVMSHASRDSSPVFEQRFAAVDGNGRLLSGQELITALRDGQVSFAAVDGNGNILSGQRFAAIDRDGFPLMDQNGIVDKNGNALSGQLFAALDRNGNVMEGQLFAAADKNGGSGADVKLFAPLDRDGNPANGQPVDSAGKSVNAGSDGRTFDHVSGREGENKLDFDQLFRSSPKTEGKNSKTDSQTDKGETAKYRAAVPLSENRISYIQNNFDSGLVKGRDAIDQLLMLLIPRNAPDAAEIMHTVVSGTDNLADLVNFLNKVLENTPDIPERQTLCDAFEDIVGEMARNQEMPTQRSSGYESETMKALTSFIDRNVNHPAIRGIDNFNASNLLQSMLNAPGVFTPLAHYIIPLQVEDTRAFGELWVDNDNSSGGSGEDQEKHYHLFLTFDVEAVGRFEVDAYSKGNKLNLSVLYPKSYRYRVSNLTDKITKIAAGVGYNVENFKTGILFKPHSLAETFPRINENRRSFDVKA